jgi:4-amino-4-deoxy-L-arabinose transferase-like glycosyltransferase
MQPPTPRRTDLFIPWLLLSLAALALLLFLVATYHYWPSFGLYGRLSAVIAILFALGGLVALVIAFVSSIFLPILRSRRRDTL